MLSLYSWETIAQVKTLHNVFQECLDNIAQGKILFIVVLILLGHHCTGKNFAQCCPRVSRKHCTGKNPVKCCLNTLGTTLFREKSFSMLYLYSWDTIAQVKTLRNVVQESPENIAQEEIVFNVVLILLGQHFTGR